MIDKLDFTVAVGWSGIIKVFAYDYIDNCPLNELMSFHK